MSDRFHHGYALLIGVGQSAYANWSLPTTVKDMQALRAILTDPDLCAYPPDVGHVRLLHDAGATRAAILDGLNWLQDRARADPDATVVLYYSGHGWLEPSTGGYYLIPHDVDPFDIPASAFPAGELTAVLRAIPARRLLALIDSCHAEGMATAKDAPTLKLPPQLQAAPLPKGVAQALKGGEGRAVFSSSRGRQRSWIRPDGSLSIYTYHLIEALQGAGNRPGDTRVCLSHLMTHLGQTVPESAQRLCQAEQIPFFDTAAEDFPVALLRGGKGLPAGGWRALSEAGEGPERRGHHAELHGSGVIAQDSTVATGGGVAVGGDVGGDVVTGRKRTVFDQRGQRVGRRIDVAGDWREEEDEEEEA
jgi:hypothetical protein